MEGTFKKKGRQSPLKIAVLVVLIAQTNWETPKLLRGF
jgi:hypothetical protein